MKTVENNEGKV